MLEAWSSDTDSQPKSGPVNHRQVVQDHMRQNYGIR